MPGGGGGLGTHSTRRQLIDVDNWDKFNQPTATAGDLPAQHQPPTTFIASFSIGLFTKLRLS